MTFSRQEFRALAARAPKDIGDRLEKQFLKCPERHARKCRICHHPERAAIEAAFMSWRPNAEILSQFGLPHFRVVLRHVHGTGLFELRSARITHAAITLVDRSNGYVRRNDAWALLRGLEVAGKNRGRAGRRADRRTRAQKEPRPQRTNAVSRHAIQIAPGMQLDVRNPSTPKISNRHFAPRLETIASH
jgi:hypothetical protein